MFIFKILFSMLVSIPKYDIYYKEGNESITVDVNIVKWTKIAAFLYWKGDKVIGELRIENVKNNTDFQAAQAIAKQREFGIQAAYILNNKIIGQCI